MYISPFFIYDHCLLFKRFRNMFVRVLNLLMLISVIDPGYAPETPARS